MLLQITAGNFPRFLYAKSTHATSVHRDDDPEFNMVTGLTLPQLIQHIPSEPLTAALVETFFNHGNWRFGIPRQWFYNAYTQMWSALRQPESQMLRINPGWLSLLFAILAFSAPTSLEPESISYEGDIFFSCAITARRITEDDHLICSGLSLMVSPADGTVLGCLAVPLLCNYLAERGRLSEAWKLVGTGLRDAEAVGMHRDPGWNQWHIMSEDERLLRRRAWWGLVIWDKYG